MQEKFVSERKLRFSSKKKKVILTQYRSTSSFPEYSILISQHRSKRNFSLKVKSNVSYNTRYTCLDTCFRVHFREENETCVPTARVGGRGERTRADQSGGEYVEKRRRWRRCDGARRCGRGGGTRGEKNDNHRHFNNMQRYSRLPRRASVATMALYNDKDTPGRLGTFRSTKGAALGSSYRTGTCFVRRGQMSPIMSWRTGGDRGRVKITVGTENIVGTAECFVDEKKRC